MPDSVAPFPPVTVEILTTTVSSPSTKASSIGSIVTVPVKEPAAITIVVLEAV